MPPAWLTALAWCVLAVAFACAAWIVLDVYARGFRQPMRVMEAVWPVTALYFGPVAVWAYQRWGRVHSQRWQERHGSPDEAPKWVTTALGVSHCGAGCTLGDVIAEFTVFAAGITLAGTALLPEYIADYLAALVLGIVFQYFAITAMRDMRPREGLVRAAKADVLSLTAFEIGLFGWMALMYFVLFPDPHLHPDRAAYWLLMQIGMVAGFFTAWPVNAWLIRRGVKEAM